MAGKNYYQVFVPEFISLEEKALLSVKVSFSSETSGAVVIRTAEFTDRFGKKYYEGIHI